MSVKGRPQSSALARLRIGGDGDLVEKPFTAQDGSQFRLQNLEGDFAFMLQILSEVDSSPCRLRPGGARSCSGRPRRSKGGR